MKVMVGVLTSVNSYGAYLGIAWVVILDKGIELRMWRFLRWDVASD